MPPDSLPLDASCRPATRPQGADAAPKVRLLTLENLDGRTAAAKLVRDLILSIEADLGGRAHLTEGTRQLVQRAAVLGAYVEDCEARWLAGQHVEVADYLSAINAQRRVLATIGLQRCSRDVTPTLDEIAAEIEAERERAEAAT